MLESASTTHSINTKARRKIFTHTHSRSSSSSSSYYWHSSIWVIVVGSSTGRPDPSISIYCQSYRTYPLPWRQSAKTNPIAFTYTILLIQRLEMRESQCLYGRNASLPTVQQKGTRQKKRIKKNKTWAVVYHSDERPWKIYAPIYLNIISNWLRWMLTCIVDRHRRRVQMRPDDEGDNNRAPRELKTTSHQNKKGEMFPPAYPSL
jgi:hypothetical protein